MVRCKSLVEQTRVLIVEVMSKEPDAEDDDQDTDQMQTGDDTDGGFTDAEIRRGIWDEDDERLNMDVARVYENTLVGLGETLGEGAAVGDL
jgi:hypothetical protein